MSTTTDILTQLEELWESAEPGPFGEDDTIVIRYGDGEYAVRPRAGYDSEGETLDHMRILERAKPKAPEWEAVVASYVHDGDRTREVWVREEDTDWWWTHGAGVARADELVDPVPLVELPEREALADALEGPLDGQSGWEWPGSYPLADAALRLLRGERR